MAGKAVFRKHAAIFGELGTRARFYGLGAGFEMVDGDPKGNTKKLKEMAKIDGVKLSVSKLTGNHSRAGGTFNYETDTMTINTGIKAVLHAPGELGQYSFSIGHSSSASAHHIYFHELGHRMFVPKDYKNRELSEEQSKIAGRVSKYGKTNKFEFLAEYYAGWTAGRKYDKETTALFHELAGANPWRKS